MKNPNDKEEILFDQKGYFVMKKREEVNGHSIDALIIESDNKVEAFVRVQSPDMDAQYHNHFEGNGLPAKAKAMKYFTDIKEKYSK